MDKQLQAADIYMTAERAKEYLDDAIDAIEIHELGIAHRRAKRAIEILTNLQGYDPRVSRAVDLVICFVTLDYLDVAEIRKAQNNLVPLAALARVIGNEHYAEVMSCAS